MEWKMQRASLAVRKKMCLFTSSSRYSFLAGSWADERGPPGQGAHVCVALRPCSKDGRLGGVLDGCRAQRGSRETVPLLFFFDMDTTSFFVVHAVLEVGCRILGHLIVNALLVLCAVCLLAGLFVSWDSLTLGGGRSMSDGRQEHISLALLVQQHGSARDIYIESNTYYVKYVHIHTSSDATRSQAEHSTLRRPHKTLISHSGFSWSACSSHIVN
ncbi:uncharacterized protein F5Z01DRAFT_243748 [Emericellopsis atlantica]|uniref:Uncharacterized protein n=1 Tax=Emericellopsis atlantica TaxID=2614577 RepID=A0A9P7ZH28_9HYPO|nr:uncharacterized protein F5Z01DRAFT_243748 [Emericellopsis atlantica]KAG9251989.1 hypothetical protein F5Z01DRAFT_243748 [Emericellopsis atlantica]